MVIVAKTNKGTEKWSGPSYWSDPLLTVDLFQKVNREWDRQDITQLFSILYKADYDTVFNAPAEIGSTIFSAIQFMYENTIDDKLEVPRFVTIDDCVMPVPKHVGKLSFGQLVMLRQKIDAAKDKTIEGELISYAAALYFYTSYYGPGKIDSEALNDLENKILKMQVLNIYPISFFLLNRQLTFGEILGGRLLSMLEWLSSLIGMRRKRQHLMTYSQM